MNDWLPAESAALKAIRDGETTLSCQGHGEGALAAFQREISGARFVEKIGLIQIHKELTESFTGKRFVRAVIWKPLVDINVDGITTSQKRALMLRAYHQLYQQDGGRFFGLSSDCFAELLGNEIGLGVIGKQLADLGYMEWTGYLSGGGSGRLTTAGVDFVESGMKDKEVVTQSISIGAINHHGGNLQVGHSNEINQEALSKELLALIQELAKSSASPEEKKEAFGLLKGFFSHPLVAAVAGGIAPAVVAALGT